jgi:hypothetical protein
MPEGEEPGTSFRAGLLPLPWTSCIVGGGSNCPAVKWLILK